MGSSVRSYLFYYLPQLGLAGWWQLFWRSVEQLHGLAAIFTMGAFTLLGLVKLLAVAPAVQNVSAEAAPIATVPYSLERQINVALK